MKTFTHKSIDYVMKNYKGMTTSEIEEIMKGMQFVFNGSNSTYKGYMFIIDSVRWSKTKTDSSNINYHYPHHPYDNGPMTVGIEEFFKQVKNGRRTPLE